MYPSMEFPSIDSMEFPPFESMDMESMGKYLQGKPVNMHEDETDFIGKSMGGYAEDFEKVAIDESKEMYEYQPRPRPKNKKPKTRFEAATTIQKFFRAWSSCKAAKAFVYDAGFTDTFDAFGGKANVTDISSVSSKYLPQLMFFIRTSRTEFPFFHNMVLFMCFVDACRLVQKALRAENVHLWQVFTKPSAHDVKLEDIDSETVRHRLRRFSKICYRIYHDVWLQGNAENETVRLRLIRTLLALTDADFVFGEDIQVFLVKDRSLSCFRCVYSHAFPDCLCFPSDEGSYTEESESSSEYEHNGIEEVERVCVEEFLYRLGVSSIRTAEPMTKYLNNIIVHQCVVWSIFTLPFACERFPSLVQRIVQHEVFHEYVSDSSRKWRFEYWTDRFFTYCGSEISSFESMVGNIVGAALTLLEKATDSAFDIDRVTDSVFQFPFVKVLDELCKKPARLLKPQCKLLKEQIQKFFFVYGAKCFQSFCENPIKIENRKLIPVFTALVTTHHRAIFVDIKGVEAQMEKFLADFWRFIKLCYTKRRWFALGPLEIGVPVEEYSKWMVPLNLFCFSYKFLLEQTMNNHRFYVTQNPVSLQELKLLVRILKEKLWYTFTVYEDAPSHRINRKDDDEEMTKLEKVSVLYLTAVLSELQAWNSRKLFVSPEEFCVEKSQAAEVSVNPQKLAVIVEIAPFLIPIRKRIEMLRSKLSIERKSNPNAERPLKITVKRRNLVNDAMDSINRLSEKDLQRKFNVVFLNDSGVRENEAEFKELLEAVSNEVFSSSFGLFKETPQGLFPDPLASRKHARHLMLFLFLGKMLGKAVFEGILLDLNFNKLLLKIMIGTQNISANDILYLDSQIHDKLFALKRHPGILSDLSLRFVTVSESGEEVELKKQGRDIKVCPENLTEYIDAMAKYLLCSSTAIECKAFKDAFYKVMKPGYIMMFNEDELQIVMIGCVGDVDVDDLQAHAEYTGYSSDSPEVIMFWEVVRDFETEVKKRLVRFVTGNSRVPFGGFKYLKPAFGICKTSGKPSFGVSKTSSGKGEPVTSLTSLNLMILPSYKSKQIMKKKLLHALSSQQTVTGRR